MTTFSILSLVLGGIIGARAFSENVRCLTRKTRTGRSAQTPQVADRPNFFDGIVWEWPDA